jgi:hypothetical protein
MRILTLIFLLGIVHFSYAGTDYKQDFDIATLPSEWASEGSFTNSLATVDGITELKMQVDKTSQWTSFGLVLPQPIDVRQNPFIKIKLRSEVAYEGFSLLIYDDRGGPPNYAWSSTYSISTDGTTILFDFTEDLNDPNLDFHWDQLSKINIRVNSSVAEWQNTLYFDYVYVGESATPGDTKQITDFSLNNVTAETIIDEN